MVVASDGRFAAGDMDSVIAMSWVSSTNPLRALAPEIFMRDYYELRLLPRLLACHESGPDAGQVPCDRAFKRVRPLAQLNRVQPGVKILSVRRGAAADEALVEIEAQATEDPSQENGRTKIDVYDLRLFRDGQLVGQWPNADGATAGGAEDINTWRLETEVQMARGQTKTIKQFSIKLARRDKGQTVRFTAYAFNEDRVKSETALDASY